LLIPLKDKDAEAEIMMVEDVVHQQTLVNMEKETVMDQVMEESMMVMLDARETLSAAATIARSLGIITMRRMTVVIFLTLFSQRQELLQ